MVISLTVQRLEGGGDDPLTGTYHYEFDQDEVLVGRDRANDVRLPHPTVSLVHLRLQRKRGRIWAVDNGSRNGTVLDGRRLEAGRREALEDGCRLRVGFFELHFGPPRQAEPMLTTPNDTARLARQMVLEFLGPASERSQPVLEVQNGPDQGKRLHLPALGGPLVVGRDDDCALCLSDADASRRHLEVQNKGEVVEVRDLGSKNGVEINETLVGDIATLADGDCLRVGNTRLSFHDPAEGMMRELEDDDAPAEQTGGAQTDGKSVPGPATGGAVAELSMAPERTGPTGGPGNLFLSGLVALIVAAALAGVIYLLL